MSEARGSAVVCYGHEVPAFHDVFPKLFRLGLDLMTTEQVREAVASLPEGQRNALGDFLGEDGIARVAEGLDPEKQDLVRSSYTKPGTTSAEDFVRAYPDIMVRLHNTLKPEQVKKFAESLGAEEIAAQSLFFGNEGREKVFSGLRDDAIRAVLDRTDDWVFLETGKRALAALPQYGCTLIKQERVGKKLQDPETVLLKYRENPKAIYMKWLAGPFKGRELVYNVAVLGTDKLRVREGGVLGIVPVTIGLDTPVAKRGTNHLVSEVGFRHLLSLIEKDYVKAAPKGHIRRVNHGFETLEGRKTYKVESILPRDEKLGYYCYRMMHWTDYLRGIEVKSEVFNFKDELQEAYYYKDVNGSPGFTDADFDPRNKAYKL
jgi:uncharacterized protein (DUF2267 family)